MNFKVDSSNKANKASKANKTSKASSTESASFASALDSAMGAEQTQEAQQTQAVAGVDNFVFDSSEQVPTNAKQRGYYILDVLEELERDILSGTSTKAAAKLEKALATESVDVESMPQVVQDLLKEIETRAIVELEKIKNS